MRETAIALALALAAGGCNTGTAASPVFESTPAQGEAGVTEEAGFAVCPPDIDASFGSIYTQMLSTTSCGSASNSCHSTVGASASQGTGNLLDYSLDAGAVYAELLGPDGGGQPAANISGSTPVLRVVPFEADASLLYIKLTLTTLTDPHYGAGMPRTAPGSVCPATVAAVEQWINAGAPFEPGASVEAGTPTDASADADAGVSPDAPAD